MAINNTGSRRLLVTLTALFAALCGLYLLIGGGWLVAIGGSWYYPIAGLVMLGVAWMLWRSKRAALWLYAALLLGTMIWGVWEVGFDFWALTPRSDILVFFGIWLILPFVWRRLVIPASGAVAALVVALLISGSILTWAGFNDPQEINGTLSADATPAEAISLKRRTKNAKAFHDKCENFSFRASNETAVLITAFYSLHGDHLGYG